MRLHVLLMIGAVASAATAVRAQPAPQPADPLSTLQGAFGTIVGNAFHAPDQIVAAVAPGAPAALAPPLGGALRTSLQIPGAAFLAVMLPLDRDAAAAVAAPASPPQQPKRKKAPRHREST